MSTIVFYDCVTKSNAYWSGIHAKARNLMHPLKEGLTQSVLLTRVWNRFRDGLCTRLDDAVRSEEDWAETDRIDKASVFRAMRGCRGVLEDAYAATGQVYCRYSTPELIEQGELDPCEQGNWKMIEYLVDFSFSVLAIPMVIGQVSRENMPAEYKYELLLAAESEMGSEDEVARDFLKILDTNARMKMLVFRARTKDGWIKRIEDRLRTVLRNHACLRQDDTILIAGVPSYVQWAIKKKDEFPYQLYSAGQGDDLVARRWEDFDTRPRR